MTSHLKGIALTLAAAIAGAFLTIPAPATADDPHQPPTLTVGARFYGHCTQWYVAYWGQEMDIQPNQTAPTADLEIDIKYVDVLDRQLTPDTYGEFHERFRHNEIPKLVQVYVDGVLIRERLFGCGYFRR
jgi:hypothetical protein